MLLSRSLLLVTVRVRVSPYSARELVSYSSLFLKPQWGHSKLMMTTFLKKGMSVKSILVSPYSPHWVHRLSMMIGESSFWVTWTTSTLGP